MRSKLSWILTPLLVLLSLSFSFAQERAVSGNVVDQDNVPLPGVSVVVVGTARGTQTDFDGNYSIRVNSNETLRFTYIGQKTVDRNVGTANVINVQMQEDAEALEEVVVQGYRTATREKSSIASQTVSAETIENRPNANVIQTLSGQVAGLDISTGSGQPGAAPTVRLRGVNSINGNTAPLYIIDGTPVDEDNFRSINPQDIESVDVLKDAGATAVYGNRGANGVILIKTKRGKFNTPLAINYTGILSYSSLQDNDYNLMDSQEQLTLENQRGAGRGATLTPQEIAAAPTFDWADFFFRTGLTQNHNLTLQSGGKNFTQFTSLGYFDQEGILQDSDLKRFSIRNNVTGRSENERFNYGTNLSINYSESNEPNAIGGSGINRNYILGAYQSVPYITPDDYTNGEDLLSPLLFSNTPLFLLDRLLTYTRREDEVKIIGSFDAHYKITPELTANIVMSADYQSEFLTRAEGPESFNALLFGGAENPTSGFQQQSSTRQFTYNQVTSLNYANSWGRHSVDAGVYTEYFKAHFRQFGYFANGLDPKTFYPGDGSGLIPVRFDQDAQALLFVDTANAQILNAGLFSYFAQADYDYDTRYGFTGTIRRDASYRFAGSNKWATFYSVAGRWNIHNEAFMDGSVFDQLKLRASYGTAGNQRISGTTYFSAPDLTENFFATGTGYANQNSLFLSQIANTTLRWETVTQFDVGVDFQMFDSKVRGTVDYYDKKTSDLFQSTPVSAINSVTSLDANTGELFNRGFDFTLNWDVIRSTKADGFNLTLNGVGNFNETEIANVPTDNGEVLNANDNRVGLRNGGVFNEYFLLRYAGVNPANGNLLFLTADGDVTENPDADTDRVWLGKNLIPKWQGSFGFNMDFKGFFMTTQFNYVTGVDRFDNDLSGFQNPDNIGQFRTTRDLLRAWTPENRVTDIPSYDAFNRAAFTSDRYLREADYVRLRFLQLGYNFPQRFIEKTGFSRLRIFGNAENLFTWTKWRGFDAEAQNNTSRLYPTPRIISLGVELGF
ncbi:SusC/RagA family TonB-linked outer membrane protein [Robiginitalea aurantiaca]|uniref:SusC/RagA family TonB-linked outer membrane protein n=1 Tax=Robiginitalea aurantiaca TaxID=3056915 RepID=A0ABT7WFE7_9FLAO|nr:SusC/RagA family TonB-linked outer membrane protein [Robiginitalea aurantiaca]MDM9631598.1 SusC/RagA family TonB-linked outer membrane protein [Robiginitalea aurantiaca]